jgi:glycine/D-amino acid oxidase-like deaminating enzyme
MHPRQLLLIEEDHMLAPDAATAAQIARARTVGGVPHTQPVTTWASIDALLMQRAAATPERLSPWTALRPMTPDGRPLIGATRIPELWLNTGHGHLGWTLAAGSADLLADLMTGRPPGMRPEAYAPARWGL